MNNQRFRTRGLLAAALCTAMVLAMLPLGGVRATAQTVQQRIAAIQQAVAANRRSLARYTWQELQAISINGEVKKQDLYQVRLGLDGTPQRTLLMNNPPPSPAGGPIRQRIVDKKTAELEQYAQQIATLAKSYAQPDPIRLKQCYAHGNVMLGSAGSPGIMRMVVTSYIQPNDSVTVIFNQAQKAFVAVQIATYLNGPGDAVNIGVQFSTLPDGTNHVASMTIDGVSEGLLVRITNGDYQKL